MQPFYTFPRGGLVIVSRFRYSGGCPAFSSRVSRFVLCNACKSVAMCGDPVYNNDADRFHVQLVLQCGYQHRMQKPATTLESKSEPSRKLHKPPTPPRAHFTSKAPPRQIDSHRSWISRLAADDLHQSCACIVLPTIITATSSHLRCSHLYHHHYPREPARDRKATCSTDFNILD